MNDSTATQIRQQTREFIADLAAMEVAIFEHDLAQLQLICPGSCHTSAARAIYR